MCNIRIFFVPTNNIGIRLASTSVAKAVLIKPLWSFMKKFLPRSNLSFSFRFTLQKKLLLAFALISILFCILGVTARKSLLSVENAIESVLSTNKMVRLTKEGNINLAKAGQLPKVIETANGDLGNIEAELNRLKEKFNETFTQINTIAGQGAQEQELVQLYLGQGQAFYTALAGFIPTRQSMLVYSTLYKGRNRPLPDVLTERELGHIKFIRSLAESIEKKQRLSGGMDYTKCGFYQWYTNNPSKDEDIAEVFEEIDPLHQKLHNYAKEIDQMMAEGNYQGAQTILVSANKDLNLLGLYFSGTRNLAIEKYEEIREQFYAQLTDLDKIYEETVLAATNLEEYLQNSVVKNSLAQMRQTSNSRRLQITLFAALGLGLAILIGAYAFLVLRNAIKSFQRVVDSITNSAQDFDAMSERMSENSNSTMTMADSASQAMEETASNIDSVASAMQEMNASIMEISNSSLASAEMAGEAVNEAKKTEALGKELQKFSEDIGTVSSTIRTIAFKINLLSLNANVEAARAGEAGAGFAVVAAEVKTLAGATAEATDEIIEKIAAIQTGSRTSAEAIASITETIANMSQKSSGIAAAVEQQSALTTDIGSNVDQVVQASNDVTQDIQNVSEAANDTNERSLSIREGAKNLNEDAEELNRLVRQF